MFTLAEKLGREFLYLLESVGRAGMFFGTTFTNILRPPFTPYPVIRQVYFIGARSLIVILVTGLFTGMVLGLQGFYILSRFGAEATLGVMVAASLVRELGPVVTALLFAGRAGSALSAEIGLMKATEQLSGLEMMAVNPIERVVAPRFLSGFISMPLLAGIFSAVGVMGGYLVAVELLGLDAGAFWSQAGVRELPKSPQKTG